MVKRLEPEDEDLHSKHLDEFALGMIAHTQDPKKVAFTLIYYTYGKREHPVKTKQAWALIKRYDCHVIVTIEKMIKAAEKIIEEYYPRLLNRKVNEEPSKKKTGRPPTKGK